MAVFYRLTGPKEGETGVYADIVFTDGVAELSDADASLVDNMLTTFYGAEVFDPRKPAKKKTIKKVVKDADTGNNIRSK
jgi:hypothetical protein